MEVTRYLVDCCVMQNDTTPKAFVGMTRAYYHALSASNRFLTIDDLKLMNGFIQGGNEAQGYRWGRAYFKDFGFAIEPENIDRLMNSWQQHLSTMFTEVDLAYFELMRIHPFVDGNGRVGSLYWNHLKCTLADPTHPPKYEDLKERYSTPIGAETESK